MSDSPDPKIVREIAAKVIGAAIEDRSSDALNCILEERGLIESAWSSGYSPWHGAVAKAVTEAVTSWPAEQPQDDGDVRAVAALLKLGDVSFRGNWLTDYDDARSELESRFADRITALKMRDGDAEYAAGIDARDAKPAARERVAELAEHAEEER